MTETATLSSPDADKPRGRRFPLIAWLGVLALALLLRVTGLGWGLPGESHHWPYHPDESIIPQGLAKMHPSRLDFNPHVFHWGGLSFYAAGLAEGAAAATGWLHLGGTEYYKAHPEDLTRLYLVGRFVSVAAGLLMIIAAAGIGFELGDRPAGLRTALGAAVMPGLVLQSHWFTPHALFLALLTAVAWSALRSLRLRPSSIPWLSTILAGAAAATYPQGVLAVVFPLAVLPWAAAGRWRRAFLVLVTFGAVMFFLTPYYLLAFEEFVHEYHRNAAFFPRRRLVDLPMLVIAACVFGTPLLIAVLGGLITLVRRLRRGHLVIILYLLAFYLVFGTLATSWFRHLLPGLVFLLPLAAAGWARWPVGWQATLLIAAVAWSLTNSLALDRRMLAPDSRDEMRARFLEVVPAGDTVAIVGWFYTPHFPMARNPVVNDTSLERLTASSSRWAAVYSPVADRLVATGAWREVERRGDDYLPEARWWGTRWVPEDWGYVRPPLSLLCRVERPDSPIH